MIVALCLCAQDPPRAFDAVIDQMARWPLSRAPDEIDVKTSQKIAGMVPDFIGSSAEVAERTRLEHPFYTVAVRKINDRCSEGFNILEFFGNPLEEMGKVIDDTIRPMAFRASAKEQFTIFIPKNFEQKDFQVLVLYSVLASRVLGSELLESGHRADAAGNEWMAKLLPDLLEISIEPGQLRSLDIGLLDQLHPEKAPNEWREQLAGRWGRCLLTFDLECAEALWTRQDVRDFVARLAQTNPAFPAYLCMRPPFGMFMVWFGSLVDRAALKGLQLDLLDPSVIALVATSIDAIQRMTGKLGANARPLIQSLLTPYPPEVTEQFLQAIFR